MLHEVGIYACLLNCT